MNCPDLEELERWASGVVEPADRVAVEAHVAACGVCREQIEAVQANLRVAGRVEALGAAIEVDAAAGSAAACAPTLDAGVPSPAFPAGSVPGYQILREISRGGQGVVYQAMQQATKRKVAIKVLVEGPYASAGLKKRFEREIELAAQLRHPNIVPVFHSGTTVDGRQYLVMDYVRGTPLHTYAREKMLALEAVLDLFAQVCEAVQYAHQRGIIHRDIKPSNILLDTDGRPKVLDFGLAKRMGGPAETLATMTHQVLGTLPYMSPEQTRGNPEEVDTRSDVYALGVVLYELLTGQFPYPVVGQMADVLRHIAETAALPPSRQWRIGSGVSSRTSGRLRPGRCPIDNEVETIVLRALAKERERRYQSAGELARDIRHYLAGEPVEAKRVSGLYLLRKTLRRHWVSVAVAGGFVLMLSALTTISTRLYWRAEEQRAVETSLKEAAIRAKEDADRAWERAGRARRRAEDSAQKEHRAFEEADQQRADFQELADCLAVLLANKGDFARAEPRFRGALEDAIHQYGGTNPHAATCMHNLAGLLRAKGDYSEAEHLFRKSLALRREVCEARPELVAQSASELASFLHDRADYDEAERLFREALGILEKTPQPSPHLVNVRVELARTLVQLKKFVDAEVFLQRAFDEATGLDRTPPSLVRSIQQTFVELHEAWDTAEPGTGHVEKVREWQERLNATNAHDRPLRPTPP